MHRRVYTFQANFKPIVTHDTFMTLTRGVCWIWCYLPVRPEGEHYVVVMRKAMRKVAKAAGSLDRKKKGSAKGKARRALGRLPKALIEEA